MSKFVKIINKDKLDNIKRFIEERQITKLSKTEGDKLKELPDSSSKILKEKRYLENHVVKFSKPLKIQKTFKKIKFNKEELLALNNADRIKSLIKAFKNKIAIPDENKKD